MIYLFIRKVRVSIHAPTRGATFKEALLCWVRVVSIHAPTRGATLLCSENGLRIMFQSTHLHEVRLEQSGCICVFVGVSIHAPTRGATLHSHHLPRLLRSFNPRTYTRCDNVFKYGKLLCIIVSIHAPTRGATSS